VLRKFGSPDAVFLASLPDIESGHLPALVAQATAKKESFKRARACCRFMTHRFFFACAAIRRFAISRVRALKGIIRQLAGKQFSKVLL
jgi:hypothetical protein